MGNPDVRISRQLLRFQDRWIGQEAFDRQGSAIHLAPRVLLEAADVVDGKLQRPSADHNLSWMSPRAELWSALADRVHRSSSVCAPYTSTSADPDHDTQGQVLQTQDGPQSLLRHTETSHADHSLHLHGLWQYQGDWDPGHE